MVGKWKGYSPSGAPFGPEMFPPQKFIQSKAPRRNIGERGVAAAQGFISVERFFLKWRGGGEGGGWGWGGGGRRRQRRGGADGATNLFASR